MADLLTHSLAAYLLNARAKSTRASLVFIGGTLLPDALNVMSSTLLKGLGRVLNISTPEWVEYGLRIFHAPMAFALVCWLLVFALPERERKSWFIWLTLGGWLHIAVDTLQYHLEGPVYALLYPFSTRLFEWGLIGTEDTLLAAPALVLIGLGVWYWRKNYWLVQQGEKV